MNPRTCFFMVLSLFVADACAATEPPAKEGSPAWAQQIFLEAGQAYDQGRLDDAIRLYETLCQRGYRLPELFYNLGNARFRSGDIARAVLNYRKAWILSPRDPDIRANLHFALRTAGAPEPVYSRWQNLFYLLSKKEWRILVATTYWLGAALACVYFWTSKRPLWLRRLLLLLLGILLLAVAGVRVWDRLCHSPEVVIAGQGCQALFAPLEGATAYFALPEGAIVRVTKRSGKWYRVSLGGREGWIPAGYGLPACP